MANKTAEQAAAPGPHMVKVDVVSATVINGAIVPANTKGIEVSEATARNLLHRGKAILAKGQSVDLSGPVSLGGFRSDADGDGIDDSLQAAENDSGKGGPPSVKGGAGSGKFDPTEPPEGAVSTVSSATQAQPGLTPAQQAEAENRKVEAAKKAEEEREAAAAKAAAARAKPATAKPAAKRTTGS